MPNPLLDAVLADMLATDFAASPVSASAYGLTEYDDRLDDVSAEALRGRDATAAELLARLDGVDDAGLTTDESIDADLARAVLRGRLIMAPFEAWRRDPVTYSAPITGGVFSLFLHRLRPDVEIAEAATARLERVAPLVDAGIANLDAGRAHPVIVERGMNAAKGAVRYVRDLAWQEVEDDAARERMQAAGEAAGRELERFVSHLESFLPHAAGSWHLGEDAYTRILREREVLPDDARQLRDRGQREFDRLDAEMTDLAKDATGNPDYVEVLRENDASHPPTEEAMLEAYAEWTAKSRAFLVETGLVSFPEGETCAVVPSPVFQRPVLGVASYVAPPAFSESLRGHFFVPFAPDE